MVKDIAICTEIQYVDPVKSDIVSLTARLRCDAFSELCCPGVETRR